MSIGPVTADEVGRILSDAVERELTEVPTEDVMTEVSERLDRRRGARRARRAGLVSAAAAAALLAVVLLWPDEGARSVDSLDPVAPPAPTPTSPDTTALPGVDTVGEVVLEVPGGGRRAEVIGRDDGSFWVTRGEEADGGRSGPDTVSEITLDGNVGPSTLLEGVARAAGLQGSRVWVVVEEVDLSEGPYPMRLKEIDRATGELLESTPLPAAGPPVEMQTEPPPVDIELPPEVSVAAVEPGWMWILVGTTLRRIPVG